MALNSITAAVRAAQAGPIAFDESIKARLQEQGKGLQLNFGNELATQINGQANMALNAGATGATSSLAAPSTYRGFALQMVHDTEAMQATAGQKVQGVLKGDTSLHSAMIAMEEASVSFQMIVEMRNKVVESLQELMRMQI